MALELQEVVAGYYPDLDVLRGVSLRAEDGRVTVVIGPNGSGKSTLLRTVFGFLHPRAGRILLDGEDVTHLAPHQEILRGVAFVPQGHSVFPQLTVEENLELGAWTLRRRPAEMAAAVDTVYQRYPVLRARRNTPAGALSGGQQRILELARALLTRPRFLLLDEPTAGLSPVVANEVYEEIARLRGEAMTILLVDQNIRKAVELADYVYVMELGRTEQHGARGEFQGRLAELIRSWLDL